MADHTRSPRNTTVCGMTGSGKTTFVIRLLLNANSVCGFVYDEEERTAPRLGLTPCYTLNQCEAALASRLVVFSPRRMFLPQPGDRDLAAPVKRGFRWFCSWIFEVCQRAPGEKIVSLPEIWKYCTDESIPVEFAMLMQQGRELGCHIVCDTSRPELVNGSVIGATTELVCFKMIEPDALNTLRKLRADVALVENQNLGEFIAYNRLTGGVLRGKLF